MMIKKSLCLQSGSKASSRECRVNLFDSEVFTARRSGEIRGMP